jgi:hypothetical protein
LTLPTIASISNGGTITIPSGADTFATLTATQTLTNKTLTLPTIASINNGGTITIPSGVGTLVTLAASQTLTNKTLTLPVISSISNGGTITIPSGADTLVTLTATQTLTNKTLTLPTIASINNGGTVTIPTGTNTLVNLTGVQTLSNKTFNKLAITSTGGTTAAASALWVNAVTSTALGTTTFFTTFEAPVTTGTGTNAATILVNGPPTGGTVTNRDSVRVAAGNVRLQGTFQYTNAPSAGAVLTSDASGNATWQSIPTQSMTYFTDYDDVLLSSSSSNYVNSTNISITPSAAGTYKLTYSALNRMTNNNGVTGIRMIKNGTEIDDTLLQYSGPSSSFPFNVGGSRQNTVYIEGYATANGTTDTFSVQIRRVQGGGNVTLRNQRLTMERVST